MASNAALGKTPTTACMSLYHYLAVLIIILLQKLDSLVKRIYSPWRTNASWTFQPFLRPRTLPPRYSSTMQMRPLQLRASVLPRPLQPCSSPSLVNQPVFPDCACARGRGRKKRSGQTRHVFEIAWNVWRNFAHLGARAVRPLCKPPGRKAPFYLRCRLADTTVSGRATEFCYFETG